MECNSPPQIYQCFGTRLPLLSLPAAYRCHGDLHLINPTEEEGTTDGKKTHQNSGGQGGAERRLAERSREEDAHRQAASGLRPRASARTPRPGDPVTARCKSARDISKARAVLPRVRVRLVSPRIAGAPGTRTRLRCALLAL